MVSIRIRNRGSVTNPFAQHVPTDQQQAGNPFAQSQPAPAQPAPQAGNPFGGQQAAPPAQQYAPQQQAAPSYAPPAPVQQYAPQQAAPVQQYAAPAPVQSAPQFGQLASAPAPVVGEGRGASLAHMFGRLVLVFPHREETVPRRPEHITAEQRAAGNVNQQRLTATVVVLDAGPGRMDPIAVDGKPNAFPPVPPSEYAPLPYVRKGMWINQSRMITQCRDFLPGAPNAGPGGAPGMLLGRVAKAGPQQNDPWYLEPATEAELQLAQKYLSMVQGGQFPNPLAA
jgi:hypothetical protein